MTPFDPMQPECPVCGSNWIEPDMHQGLRNSEDYRYASDATVRKRAEEFGWVPGSKQKLYRAIGIVDGNISQDPVQYRCPDCSYFFDALTSEPSQYNPHDSRHSDPDF